MIKQAIIFLFYYFQIIFIRKKNNSILLIADYNSSGGTRTYFISLLYYLHENNFNVTILDNDNIRDNEINTIVKELDYDFYSIKYDFWGIDFNKIPAGISKLVLLRNILYELNFWSRIILKFRFEKFIFSTGYPGKNIYSFILPIKILYVLHSSVTHRSDNYMHYLLRIFLSKKKQILTVSDYSCKRINELWLNGKSSKYVNYIHNYYEPKYDKILKQITRHTFTVLSIGSVEEYKNPLFFIQVAKETILKHPTKKIRFIWAGTGSLLPECIESVRDFPEIQFLGEIDNVEILYAEADLYFQPSKLESHGIAVLGAMYHKIPCIVSDQGGMPESILNNFSGFTISLHNTLEAVNKMNNLISDKRLYDFIGTNALIFFKEKFSEDKWKDKMSYYLY